MNFLKTSSISAVMTAVSMVTKLVTNKIVAVYLGPNGMFLLGQLKDFVKFTNVFSTFGSGNGVIKYTSQFSEDDNILKQILGTAFKIHILFSTIAATTSIIFREELSTFLFKDDKYENFILILGISFITISLHNLFIYILNGFSKIRLYVIINIISTIISGIVLAFLVYYKQVEGAFMAFAINQILVFFVSFTLVKLYYPKVLSLIWSEFKFEYLKKLSNFSIMSITGTLTLIISTLFIRSFIETKFSENHAGSWEGMWRISAMYLLFLTTTFKLYVVPTFAKLEKNELRKEVFKLWKYIFPIIAVITFIVFLLKGFIVKLLFSDAFNLMLILFGFHLLGDIIKMNCWVLGNILITKSKTKTFVLLQIEWSVVFIILSIILVDIYGFKGIAIAYFCAYLVHFTIMNIYFRKLLWTKSSN